MTFSVLKIDIFSFCACYLNARFDLGFIESLKKTGCNLKADTACL